MTSVSVLTTTTAPRTVKPVDAPARSRSLGGCETCRRRHAKCDETRPSCLVCERAGLVCERYEIRLLFDASDSQGSRCRRPLFTEDMRQRMSEQLAASLDPDDVHTILTRMEDHCEKQEEETSTNFTTHLGPFGAFRIVQPEIDLAEIPTDPVDEPPQVQDSSPNIGLDMALDDAFSNDPLMECLFGHVNVDASGDFEAQDFFATTLPFPERDEISPQSLTGGFLMGSSSVPLQASLLSSPEIRYAPSVTNLAPPDAPLLLAAYKNNVTQLFSPIQLEKSPWGMLYVPPAMETLALLAMGELANNTRMSIFYAILATSAFNQRLSTATRSSNEYWQRQAETFAVEAQSYLKRALHDASSSVKKTKYKDVLIALLCMNTVSAYQGSPERVRRCLLDCENWIQFRGLPKTRKSRKVRLLHHCYVYLRIFQESTSVLPVPHVEAEIDPASPETVRSVASTRSFRLRQWEGRLDQRMSELKEQHQGENDLHLEIPGRWDSTMYPQIFGMPESLLFLLSQVTRLGNERDLSDSGTYTGALDFKQFAARARSLERCISTWRPPPISDEDADSIVGQANATLIRLMLSALHKALLIFFYRRVYDVDPMILQDKAWQVRDALAQVDRDDVPGTRVAAPFAWAAFIAACEALEPTLQDWFATWFETSARRSGLGTFKLALRTARQVWERQRHPLNSSASTSWPQIMRESNLSLFYI
ncbi:C6 transcription factor [Aspergillus sclerotioniger CBS 115572]|uniref:C6 transcription factor n=1 Tax=Aspergillus sclerotioniger CBS 115572 TaxID=1450535 RepID=A0A317X2W3_9EURO|nr:C6 transcription factor [Aspergillus sclerotioniger CBS 115572]PWY92974.1 C6 transcription factor [Aspergillus sclerotioniger CBS 115572]